MHAALTVRRLKPGTYDAWREAWEPEEWPEGVKAYILRNTGDPNEVIAFGLFEGDIEEMRRTMEAGGARSAEEARQARMAEFVESTGADGLYEVVEQVGAHSVRT